MQTLLFYIFFALAGLSAAGILLTKNIFKAALLLLVCLLSLAALYVFAFAEFLAVTQIMIYAGGVVVLIIFGIMLTNKISGTALKVSNAHIFSALLGSVMLFGVLFLTIRRTFGQMPSQPHHQDTIHETGVNLMIHYVLPFEIAGVLLLIALIGATVISTVNSKKE